MGSLAESFVELPSPVTGTGIDDFISLTSMSSSDSSLPSGSTTLPEPCRDRPLTTHGSKQTSASITASNVFGQFSFAPATKTTVVTTTTTTTMSFPPLVMKAPLNLHELDSKLYPLAANPTPQSMKRLYMDMGGKPIIFQETDDAASAKHTVSILYILLYPMTLQGLN